MSDGGSFEFNNTVSGDGAQINQGQTVSATQTNQIGGGVTFEQFLSAIQKEIPEADQQRIEAEALAPLREIASQPEPTNEQDRVTLKARIYGYLTQLEPYTPYIRKTLAAFAEGALSTIPPPASWVIAGCVEVVRDARKE